MEGMEVNVIRKAAVVVVSLFTLLGLGLVLAPAASAQYNPNPCGFIITPTTVAPGQTINIVGQNFPPNQPVTFTLAQFTIATATADANGNVNAIGTIPAELPDGTYTISVDCLGVSSTQSVNVSSASAAQNPGGSTAGSLAVTGADVLPFVKAALVLLALGGLLVIATRRRGGRHHDRDAERVAG
ncbi:MAG: hypothetical protein HYX32_10475 [Actinobacteria bacterium]|nr:hypothetical protein [Actinomycetota bacterium]